MGLLNKIFGNKEERQYKAFLAEVCNPLWDKIDALEEREVRDFFKTIIDAAERSLRGILFMAPDEFSFKKQITKDEIDFWLRKVSLALMSYSYYFYGDSPQVENNPDLGNLVNLSYKAYWQRMFDSYNKIFGENVTLSDINYYATGLKEDNYSDRDMERMLELAKQDYTTIATELLRKIWNENIDSKVLEDLKRYKPPYGTENLDPMVKKICFLGIRIWQAHEQIVQPFLAKLLEDY